MNPLNDISRLIINDAPPAAPAAVPNPSIQRVTCNLLPKLVRHDTMEGKDFLVVPMVMLTEGVHKGSGGPLYYGPKELGKTPVSWNMKPVVVYHPENNGQPISACDPGVLTNRKIGVMMNTQYEKGKLKSEAWIDPERANAVDPRIMAAIEKNEMMELSTGVFVDEAEAPGEWNGESYNAVATNFRPDHLAVLPDKIGACSIADGAGFLRNERADKKNPVFGMVRKALARVGLLDNEMSFDNIRSDISMAVRDKMGAGANGMNDMCCYVTDVYSNFAIYEYDNQLYRIGYTATDTGVTLSDEKPVKVNRVTEYRTVEGAYVGNQRPNTNTEGLKTMNKKELVDSILANNSGWAEGDRASLMALNEEQLKRIQTVKVVEKPAAAATTTVANTTPENVIVLPAAAPAAPKPTTLKEYVDAAPSEMREVLNNSMAVYNEEKAALVAGILANKNHGFTQADLTNRPLGELRNLAKLAGVGQVASSATQNFAGMAQVQNGAEAEEVLTMPVMNFSKEAATAAK